MLLHGSSCFSLDSPLTATALAAYSASSRWGYDLAAALTEQFSVHDYFTVVAQEVQLVTTPATAAVDDV